MKKSPKHSIGIILSVILYLFLAVTSALAQTPAKSAGTPYQPIRKVDLGITSLTLEVGEKYTFSVSFDPKDSPVTRLTWFNTDNTVVAVNQLTNTVTVLTPGTARVMAESFDKEAYAVCEITVSGPQEKDLSGMVEGKALLTLSAEDREKIKASQINRYLDLLEMSVFNEETLQKLQNQTMDVMAEVRPGTEEAESERALALGMTRAYPMKHLHLVSLYGTFSQLLEFVKGNGNLIRIFKGHDTYIFDPRPESDASPLQTGDSQGTDTTMLQGHVEELTSVSTMHKLGYTGKGSTIAIVDTGLNSSHEQFAGRLIAENCFSYSWHCKPIPGCQPCDEDDTECAPEECYDCDSNLISAFEDGTVENYGETYSAFPGGAGKLSEFNHGSHVAGISAGKDGMAPGANIIAVAVQSEFYNPYLVSVENPTGYTVTLWNHDIYAAYDWLLEIQDELKKEGKPISILNLSLGSGQHADYCDNDDDCAKEYGYFRDLNAAGILPAAASGNEFLDDAVSLPGCLSNTLSVGALADMDTPYIVCYSNHNNVVDILAPGTNIWSSYLVDPDGNPVTNSYGSMSGTSMATPVVSGALALIMEAFPGKTLEEYKTILVEMSTKTAYRRNSNGWNFTTDDGTGTVFPFTKPVLDFSNFPAYYASRQVRRLNFYLIGNLEYEMPKTGFSAIRPQKLSSKPFRMNYTPTRLTLQLPTLDVEADIVTVPYIDEEYPVEWLGSAVGMLEGSNMPGEGITVLTGHNHLNTTEAGPFALLSKLESGDSLMVTDSRGAMQTYKVYKSAKVPSDGFGRIAGDLKENALVLITCEDESIDGGYLNRRVIFALPD